MKKIITIAIAFAMIFTSGCIDEHIDKSGTETVSDFKNHFDSQEYSFCYQMMTNEYQRKHDFKNFIEICKDKRDDSYQFIELGNEYQYDNTALVEIKYNITGTQCNTFDILCYLKKMFETETSTITKEGEIEMVRIKGEWKFNDFPEILV
nr:hypothetical protein [uncultured Methanolobus sp.]